MFVCAKTSLSTHVKKDRIVTCIQKVTWFQSKSPWYQPTYQRTKVSSSATKIWNLTKWTRKLRNSLGFKLIKTGYDKRKTLQIRCKLGYEPHAQQFQTSHYSQQSLQWKWWREISWMLCKFSIAYHKNLRILELMPPLTWIMVINFWENWCQRFGPPWRVGLVLSLMDHACQSIDPSAPSGEQW